MPSFKLFCTEAFQFDYEAPFHRAWMLRAIQNEIEPLVGWTAASLCLLCEGIGGQEGQGLSPHCLVGFWGNTKTGRALVAG